MEGLAGFILAALALTGSPGPANLSLAATGAAFGPRRGMLYSAGIIAGLLIVMLLSGSSLAGIVLAQPGVAPLVTTLVVAYFLYLAFRIATAPPLAEDAGEGKAPSFAAGLALSLVNPKGYAAMASLFSGFVLVRGAVLSDAAAKTALLLAIVTAVNAIWLLAGAALTRAFRNRRANRAINLVFAALLLASLAWALPG